MSHFKQDTPSLPLMDHVFWKQRGPSSCGQQGHLACAHRDFWCVLGWGAAVGREAGSVDDENGASAHPIIPISSGISPFSSEPLYSNFSLSLPFLLSIIIYFLNSPGLKIREEQNLTYHLLYLRAFPPSVQSKFPESLLASLGF